MKDRIYGRGTRTASIVFLFLAALIAAPGCAEKDPSKLVLAKVNGSVITLQDLQNEMDRVEAQYASILLKNGVETDRIRTAILQQMIDERLILSEGRKKGIELSREELEDAIWEIRKEYPGNRFNEMLISQCLDYQQWRRRLAKRLLLEKIIRTELLPKAVPTEGEIKRYYQEHPKEFRVQEQLRARQIVVYTEDKAREILRKIKAGADFAEMAMKVSRSPDARKGGDLGYFSRGVMPEEFDKVLFKMKPGQISKVIKSPYGYHIFKLEERLPARRLPLDEVRETIKKRLMEKKLNELYTTWIKKLQKEAKITINEKLLYKEGNA